MSTSVKEFSKVWWTEVYNRIIGAVVILDESAAECLHWDGGLYNLLNGGAVAVNRLSPFQSCKPEQKKVVFITQTTQIQLRTISDILRTCDFTHCILISTVSLDVVYLELNDGLKNANDVVASGKAGMEAVKMLEKMLVGWMKEKQPITEVVYIPIFTISPTNNVFLMPPYQYVYPKFDKKLITSAPTLDLYTLNSDERSEVRRLASALNSMMQSMNMREDIYHIGPFSSLIAGILENSPVYVSRRKMCTNPVSLIFVDRTLDLCGVTSHSTESVLDKVMAVLPRFPGHCTDVAVDMSPLCEAKVVTHPNDMQLSPGCLYHADDEASVQTYDHMINKSQKEVMFDLHNKLSKLDVQMSPGLKTLLKVTPQSVEKIITASKGNYDVISKHLGILQQSLGVVQALKSPKGVQLELLSNLEKQVLQSIAASRESTSILHQMRIIIRSRKERKLSIENLLALLIHIYSLSDSEVIFNKQHEENLEQSLIMAVLEEFKTLFDDRERNYTPKDCEMKAKEIMCYLKEISQMRKPIQRYHSVLKPCDAGTGHEYRGVLQQLVDDLVNTDRPDLVDLQHRNDGIKDLLRTGLNILTSKRKSSKHPLDNPTVLLFVVGGVTAEECKQLHRSVITSGVDTVVLIGSTKFVTPVEAMRDVFNL
ncbi:sec1 family domain-containing protein 2 [Bicyclus anynana]|uniref:Sec1 family domain-containing protein 2 n=1 Tax=Bicyclus anynana TaxID=110368 RepID=A0ABM3LQV2_BICAN|nr:sec1 family domain-containing protein 2 [Bicyclus anynana]